MVNAELLLKRDLRGRFRDHRHRFAQNSQQKNQADQTIRAHLAEFIQTHAASSVWASYLAMGDEPVVVWSQREWAYPVLDGESLRFRIPYPESVMTPNRFGILEPRESESHEVAAEDLAGVVVPGVAFDRAGGRLGQGQGFYDRALQNYTGFKMGVAYEAQISTEPLPCSSLDVRMNYVVTERGLSSCD